MCTLTVGIPVYNGMPFLPESIQSLLMQTCNDFEVLAIDDGSTDGSLEYLLSLKDKRLRVLSQTKRGLTQTLNRMLREVDTPWLIRQDADDVSYPRRIQLIRDNIREFADAGMFYSYARYHSNGRSLATFRTTRASPEELRRLTQSGYLLAICHPTVTLNVNKTLAIGAYRFDLHVEDLDLWWRMALNYEIRLVPEMTVGFRLNERSVSTRNLESQAVNALYVQYLLLSHLWGLRPQAYEIVREALTKLVDRGRLRSRHRIRLAQIDSAKGNYVMALRHGLAGIRAAPLHFLTRVAYEFMSDSAAVNGVNPRVFTQYRRLLWPHENGCSDLDFQAAR